MLSRARVHFEGFAMIAKLILGLRPPSQWETSLQSNAVSHWLVANLGSSLRWPHVGLHGWPLDHDTHMGCYRDIIMINVMAWKRTLIVGTFIFILLNKQSNCQWFERLWRSCDVTVISASCVVLPLKLNRHVAKTGIKTKSATMAAPYARPLATCYWICRINRPLSSRSMTSAHCIMSVLINYWKYIFFLEWIQRR